MTWTDDIAICNLAEKLAFSDEERPFVSHSHPNIEEYKFILSGSGSVTIGVGDETCEEEYYELLNDPGTFIKMNSRETYNVYCPNPIECIEKNPTDMTHLRPDLFPETEA